MRRMMVGVVLIGITLAASAQSAIGAQPVISWPPDPAALFTKAVTVFSVDAVAPSSSLNATPQPSHTPCGTMVADAAYKWAISQNPVDHRAYLCELVTGRLAHVLPNTLNWANDPNGCNVTPSPAFSPYPVEDQSPSDTYVVFSVYAKSEVVCAVSTYFSYNPRTNQLIQIGDISDYDAFQLAPGMTWATDTEFYVEHRQMSEWSTTMVDMADITRPFSVKQVLSLVRFEPFFVSNPPRLEAVTTTSDLGGDVRDARNCTRTVYFFTTHITQTIDYGDLCVTEYGDPLGVGYYRDVQSDGTAILVRYDVRNKSRKELYRGEIERVYWVSADEHYAVLKVDHSGKIDCPPGEEFAGTLGCPFDERNAHIVLVDLIRGQTLYSNQAASSEINGWLYSHDPSTSSAVVPLDPTRILLLNRGENTSASPEYDGTENAAFSADDYAIVTLSTGYAKPLPFYGGALDKVMPVDGRLFFHPDGTSNSTALEMYDPSTERVIPLIRAFPQNDPCCTTIIEKVEGDLLTVRVLPSERYMESHPPFYGYYARYVLRLPHTSYF